MTWTDEVLGMGRAGSLIGGGDRTVDGAPSESAARVNKMLDLGIRRAGCAYRGPRRGSATVAPLEFSNLVDIMRVNVG